jgi:hypothetical protein
VISKDPSLVVISSCRASASGEESSKRDPRLIDGDPHLVNGVEGQLEQSGRTCSHDAQDMEGIRPRRHVHGDRCRNVVHRVHLY